MDGNSPLCKCLIQCTHQPADLPPCDWIPAVHAGMTGFNHLCITVSGLRGNADLHTPSDKNRRSVTNPVSLTSTSPDANK